MAKDDGKKIRRLINASVIFGLIEMRALKNAEK